MQEIVDQVLAAERQAEAAVQDARAQAAEIRRQADGESEARVQEARQQAQSIIQDRLAEARERAAREREESRAEAERRNARFLQERGEALREAAEAVVTLLVTPEYARRRAGDEAGERPPASTGA